MQSIERNIKTSTKDQIRQSTASISIIPKISQPNQILPKKLQLSRPPSHIFLHDFADIQSESGTQQLLCQQNQIIDEKYNSQALLFSLYTKKQGKQSISFKMKPKINKLRNLKEFLLQDSQKILFLSRTLSLIFNETQKLLFRKLLSVQCQNITESSEQFSLKYRQNLKKLTEILLSKPKFPFLCPQLNQNVSQNSSLNNAFYAAANLDYLTFNDNFQSSNILLVKQFSLKESENPLYCICTRFDYQTSTYGQWFYFSVRRHSRTSVKSLQNVNFGKKKNFKFIICNMTKRYSMLGVQMKISVCRKGIWGKQGTNIHYYQTLFKRGNKKIDFQTQSAQQIGNYVKYHQLYYALQFQISLQENQQVFVSYNEPYTISRLSRLLDNCSKVYQTQLLNNENNTTGSDYTDLQSKLKSQDLFSKKNIKRNSLMYRRQNITQTPLKNQIQCLTFSMRKQCKKLQFQQSDNEHTINQQGKRIIFIMARAHPIQTAGSFVIQGILRNLFLFSEYQNDEKRKKQLQQYFATENKAQLIENLFKNFIIKIIPMINPDGVILGNSRCNFYGFDLNRQWKRSNKNLSLQVYALKRFLLKFKDRIQMVIDLHGHSKQRNVFAYGLHDFRNPFSTRQFPYILSKLTDRNFLFNQCRFTRLLQLNPKYESDEKAKVKENSKQGTARIWLFRKLQIPNIFTIQNSYCGSMFSKFHYDSHSYGLIGKQILLGICLYFINFTPSKKDVQRSERKNKRTAEKKQFKEDATANEFQSMILTMDQLKFFKESMILDLKSRQQNATIGMEEINDSQSESQHRLEDQIYPNDSLSPQKQRSLSPNKSKSHHLIKKVYLPEKIKQNSRKQSRYSTNQDEQLHTFNFKHKIQHMQPQKPSPNTERLINSRINLRQNSRYISELKQKIKQHGQKKQAINHKSTTQLQKNVTLSIVELGFDNSNKLLEQKIIQNERQPSGFHPNTLLNFPQINFGSHIHMVYAQKSNLNITEKINEKLKNRNVLSYDSGNKNIIRKPSQCSISTDVFQKLQQKRNVTQFMKKIESNRKLQHQIVTSRKIQKYKQIIMKINGDKY